MTTPPESCIGEAAVGWATQFQSTPDECRAVLDRNRLVLLRARLDEPPDTVARLRALLSDDECRRAGRYRFEKDRRRFIVARGTLRSLVCRFLGGDPREPRFAYAPNGKPYLPESRLQFNLSHSHELAVYAFAWNRVGVDVEHVAGVRSFAGIAERYFSPGERALLAATPAEQRQRRFFAIWALKEAFVKATGEGMAGIRRSNTMYDTGGDAGFEPMGRLHCPKLTFGTASPGSARPPGAPRYAPIGCRPSWCTRHAAILGGSPGAVHGGKRPLRASVRSGRPGEIGGWAFSTFALDADYVGAWCVESR